MSNLSLVLIWNRRLAKAVMYADGAAIDTFNHAPESTPPKHAPVPILHIARTVPNQIDVHRARAQSDRNLSRLKRLTINKLVGSLDIAGPDRVIINLMTPLSEHEADILVKSISDLYGDADVSSGQQADVFVRPDWMSFISTSAHV